MSKNNPRPRRERKFKTRAPRVSRAAVDLVNDKYLGADEPEALDFTEAPKSALIRALNWYNARREASDARKWTAEFLALADLRDEARTFRKLPDTHVSLSLGWCCRLLMNGATLPEEEMAFVQRKLRECLEHAPETDPDEPAPSPSTRGVRERVRERTSEILGEVEGLLDDSDGVEPVDLYMWLSERSIPPVYCAAIVAKLTPRWTELQQAAHRGCDPQLREGYRHMTKQELLLQASIVSVMILDAQKYAQDKKLPRKRRRMK